MRIISGKYRGKVLMAPRNLPTRPTTDFAKEALFNLMNNHFELEMISVLDLFAGTGNIGFEFASRGAESITAVDNNGNCVKYINTTAAALKFENMQAHRADAIKFVERAYRKWDVVFADPPYEFEGHELLVNKVFEKNILEDEGMLVIEHSKRTSLEEHPRFRESRNYGNVTFSFFE
jgi:16S rRNA (guanine966-N2)-methyltransferase